MVNCHEKFLFNVLLVSLVLGLLARIYTSPAKSSRGLMLYTSHQHDYLLIPSLSPGCPRELSWAVAFFPYPSLGRFPPWTMLSILEPVSSFCLKGVYIAGTVGLLVQRSLWEKGRIGLC